MNASEAESSIAIVGMAGRFPGAPDLDTFWANLRDGVPGLRSLTDDELAPYERDLEEFRRDPDYVPATGMLDDVEMFDAEFFGIQPREARSMDPQQRIWLETAWECMENAGYAPDGTDRPVGVYCGSFMNSYLFYNLSPDREAIEGFVRLQSLDSFTHMISNERDYLPTRTSFLFNLTGPAINVQTACSTSLVAISLASQSLLNYESDMALAGGVTLFLPQERGYFYVEGGMRSSDGLCRPFDAKASGTVFASGVGCIMLKRLDDAVADRDNILAVIRSTALNNDGVDKASFTAPSIDGQAEVISMAHSLAGIEPESISYVEAHGTATPMGDPIEVAALTKAFRAGTDKNQFAALGAVKSNVGHLDAASGVAGVIKTVLSLQNEAIPPTLNYEAPNPAIDFESSPFYVADRLTPWPKTETPRRAGISSFGVGGTNAHAVLQEAPDPVAISGSRSRQLVMLSAKSAAALDRQVEQFATMMESTKEALPEVAYTLNQGRSAFSHRRIVVGADKAEVAQRLREPRNGAHNELTQAPGSVVFMFPGQGSQYAGMGAELHESEPVFRAAVDECARLAEPHLGLDLRTVLYPTSDIDEANRRLEQTYLAQPSIFTVSYALAELWESWGVTPEAMVGHSVGEFVAATRAGVFSLGDALRIIAERGRLMQDLPGGDMRAVRLSVEELQPHLGDGVALAASNAPGISVVSGPHDAIVRFEERMSTLEQDTIELHTSHAFHSEMMEPILAPFQSVVASAERRAPSIPIVSTLTGTWLTDEQAVDPDYWTAQLRNAVRFSDALMTLADGHRRVLLEVGPGKTLSNAALQHRGENIDLTAVDSLGQPKDPAPALDAVLASLGRLWTLGVDIDWNAYWGDELRRRVQLPTYPWERTRHWVDPPPLAGIEASPSPAPAVALPSSQPLSSQRPTKPEGQKIMERLDNIALAVAKLMSDFSGIELPAAEYDTPFVEMGFDSLTLTQTATLLKREMGVPVRFRELLGDLSTVTALSAHLAEAMPSDRFAAEAPPAPVVTAAEQPAGAPAMATPIAMPAMQMPSMPAVTGDAMQMQMQMMQQTMQLLQQQMMLMSGSMTAPVAPAPVAEVATEPAAAAPVPADRRRGPKAPERPGDNEVSRVRFGPYKEIKKEKGGALTATQQAHLDALTSRLLARTASSRAHAERFRGVQADPRSVAGFHQHWKDLVYQIVTERSAGSHVWDIDGNDYVDITTGFGIGFLGHSPDFVTEAIADQLGRGLEIGPQMSLAGEVAELVREITGNERVSFCNTGSEGLTAAVRLARTYSGRDKIVYFSGDYHGVFDEVVARPQILDGELLTVPASPGITDASVENAWILDYGSEASLAFIREHADEIAAVVIEPIQSRHPENRPAEFIKEIRSITAEHDVAMVFDEVITGFRVALGGAKEYYGVEPDLCCYGKILGGGVPIGAVAGIGKYMDGIDGGAWSYGDDSVPEADLAFFAGTFVRHPMAMAAAKAVLTHLKAEGGGLQERLNERTAVFAAEMNAFFDERQVPIRINQFSSWFRVEVPTSFAYADLLFYHLIDQGVYVFTAAQNCFFSVAHSDDDIDHVKEAFRNAVLDMQLGGFLPDMTEAVITPFELADSQEEIFVASAIGAGAANAYTDSFAARLRGPLHRRTLEAAARLVIARHGALHHRFSSDGERQTPVLAPQVRIDPVDLRAVGAELMPSNIEATLDALMRRPMDHVGGILYHCQIVRIADEDHILQFSGDHIAYDGWSAVIVIDEIRTCYNAFVAGVQPELPAVDTVRDFVGWQREISAGEEGRRIADFWSEKFETTPEPISLPTDHPVPGSWSYGGASVHHEFHPETMSRVGALASHSRTTPFAVMLAAFYSLLHRLSGSDDLVVGIPTAGQVLADLPNLVGQCVQNIPLRMSVNPDEPFDELVKRAAEELLDGQDHLPFTSGNLSRDNVDGRRSDGQALQVIGFNLDRRVPEEPFTGLETTVREVPIVGLMGDIFCNLFEESGGLFADCHYNTDLFDEATIARWLSLLDSLIATVAANPSTRVGDVPLVAEGVVAAAVAGPQIDYGTVPMPQRIAEMATREPGRIAIRCDGREITYGDLLRRADHAAQILHEQGLTTDSIVGVMMERSIDVVVAMLAVWRSGAAYLPLDPSYPRARLAAMIEDASPVAVIAHGDFIPDLPQAYEPVFEWNAIEDADVPPVATALPGPGAGDLAYVIFTSGSTGRPKAVQVPHYCSLNFLSAMATRPGMTATDVVAAISRLSFDPHTLEIWLPLSLGARVAIATDEEILDGHRLADLLVREGATIMEATPPAWKLLLETGWGGLPGLKMLTTGEPLLRPLADALLDRGGELWNMYGPTEVTVYCSVDQVTKDDDITVGTPIDNYSMFVLDSAQRILPVGVIGEIYVGGVGVTPGYLNRPELSAERFGPNPFGGGFLYRTGDLGRLRADGRFDCLGRVDNQVKVAGHRIELGEIESALVGHAEVRDAAVAVVDGPTGDATIVGHIVTSTGAVPKDVRAHLHRVLPRYMLPSRYVVSGSLPTTSTGKLDRSALPPPDFTHDEQDRELVAPRDEAEQAILDIWRSQLGVDGVGVTDDLFDLGATSIQAVRANVRIREALGVELELVDMFEESTVAGLAVLVAKARVAEGYSATQGTSYEDVEF